jgi:hypothetical protein
MDVRVVRALTPLSYPEQDYVRVHTCTDPADDTVTLATIERIVDKTTVTAEAPARRRVKTLVMRQPMSADDALGLATRYAERKKIPVVFADRS